MSEKPTNLPQGSTRPPPVTPAWRSRSMFAVWGILALTVMLTAAGTIAVKRFVHRQERTRFTRESTLLFEEIGLGQQANLAKFSTAQLRLGLGRVDESTWREVEQGAEWSAMHPWLRQFGWADAVPGSVTVRFLSNRSDTAPLHRGLDLMSDPVYREALATVATNGKRAATRPLKLITPQGQDARLGVVVLFPVWENTQTEAPNGVPRGYLVATIDPVAILEASWTKTYRILATNSVPLLTPTNIAVVPRPGHTIRIQLLPHEPNRADIVRDRLHPVRGDEMLGRMLYYATAPTREFDEETPQYLPIVVLWGGLATGLLFCLVVLGQVWRRIGAEQTARELTLRAESLRASEERFRAVIENSFDIIMVLNPDGGLKYMSPSGHKLFALVGTGAQPGGGIEGLVHPDDLPLIAEAHRDVIAHPDGPRRVPCYRVITRDGSQRFVEAIGTNCLDVPGVEGIVVNIRDITERKLAEDTLRELNRDLERRVASRTSELAAANAQLQAEIKQKRRLVSILDATSDLVAIAGMDRRVLYINPAGRRLLGLTQDDDLSAYTSMSFYPGEVNRFFEETAFPIAFRDGIWTGETRMLTLAGTEIPVAFIGLVMKTPDGTPDHFACIAHDITHRIRIEDDLRTALATERELHRLKSNFVSMVSHEVRTPLATILSSSGLLQDYSDRLPPERRTALLQHIVDAARQMAANMENVLLLSRMESASFECHPQRMKLGDLCRQVANEVDSATHRRCPIVVEVTDDAGREVAVDPSIIRHIFVNLLSNAVKYSEPNVPVLFKLRREGTDAIIVVRDEGIGIPVADQARLFQAFKRGSNSGSTPGTGIGLVIVKRCVEVLHGRIDIESKEQEGTVVTVRLPLYEEPAEASPI